MNRRIEDAVDDIWEAFRAIEYAERAWIRHKAEDEARDAIQHLIAVVLESARE